MAWDFLTSLLPETIDTISKGKLSERKRLGVLRSEKRFDLYFSLWKDLIELKDIMDQLWVRLDRLTLQKYISQLKKLDKLMSSRRIILPGKEYSEIKKIIKTLEDYRYNKEKILDMNFEKGVGRQKTLSLLNVLKSENATSIRRFEVLVGELEKKVKKYIGVKK